MLILRAALLFLVFTSGALAEVCDKVAGDAWMPQQGPVDIFTVRQAVGWVAVTAIVAAGVAWSRSRTLAWVATTVAFLVAAFVGLLPLIPDDDGQVTRAAIREGCLSAGSRYDAARFAIIGAVAAAIVLFVRVACGRAVIR